MDDTDKKSRIISRAATQKPHEYPVNPASDTGGVLPMSIQGRFHRERARLGPDFTEAERQWRVRWHHDQHLHPSEPLPDPPGLKIEKYWWLRRLYRKPGDYIEERILTPRLGFDTANGLRRFFGKLPLVYGLALCVWYQLKYQSLDWEVKRRSYLYHSKEPKFPGDEGYGEEEKWDKWDWCNANFNSRTAFRDVHNPNRWIH